MIASANPAGRSGAAAPSGSGVRVHLGGQHRLGGASGKRRLPAQELVSDHAHRVEVGAAIDLLLARRLLRGHVRRRPDRQAERGEGFMGSA